jgi:outer membrane receptor protein involved in Fe transport
VSVSPSGLKPETSFGEDAGFDLRLPRATTISFDLYNTSVSGQFYTSYQRLGTYLDLPLYASEAANLGRSRYYGLTLSAIHLPPRGLTWGLAGSLQRAYAYDIPSSVYYNPTDPSSPNNLGIVPNINYDGYDNLTAIPYAQGRATVGFRGPRLATNLGLTYYGNNNSYYRPAFAALDLTGSYRLARNTTLNVSVANLTNAYGQFLDNPNDHRLLPLVAGSSTSPYQFGSNIVYPQVYGPPAISINIRQAFGN